MYKLHGEKKVIELTELAVVLVRKNIMSTEQFAR